MTKEEIELRAQKCFAADKIDGDARGYVAFAFWLLENGIQSDDIFILAGIPESETDDLRRYFFRVIDALGIEIDAGKTDYFYVCHLFDEAKSGKYSPSSAVFDLQDIFRCTENPIFREWSRLGYQIELADEGFLPEKDFSMTKENLGAYILRFFELWRIFCGLDLPDGFSKQAYCLKCGSRIFPKKIERGFFRKRPLEICPKCKSEDFVRATDNLGRELYLREIGFKEEKMSETFRCVNLNVHYSAPESFWRKIGKVFRNMDFYDKSSKIPRWQTGDFFAEYSLEPSGMQLSSNMPEYLWLKWFGTLKKRLSDSLGCQIGEVEDGFGFAGLN